MLAVVRGSVSGGWQGPTLDSALRKVSAKVAATSIERRRSIWQHCLHAAFWKHRVLNQIAKRSRFPRRGQHWPDLPAVLDEDAWTEDLKLLDETNRRFLEAVEVMPASRYTTQVRRMIFGVAAHDAYHAGQINLLRRMLGDR
ncbi:MAG: DinB family protein [Phycisphaerales bacterium]|nr:DinB family protein [Phycisphaerales bacterium]